jgi:uncharacterized protein DUF1801
MAEPKTTRTDASVPDFLGAVADPRRRADAEAACALIAGATGATPEMWGSAIVGFGQYHYRGASGGEGDWMTIGLSPRKRALTFYLTGGLAPNAELLARLGPHTTGKGCLYVKRLADVDEQVLRELVTNVFRRYDGQTVVAGPS